MAVVDADVGVAGLTVEESKYLGGDVEHTHLVKGLDYALLHQVGGPGASPARGAVVVASYGRTCQHGVPPAPRWCSRHPPPPRDSPTPSTLAAFRSG